MTRTEAFGRFLAWTTRSYGLGVAALGVAFGCVWLFASATGWGDLEPQGGVIFVLLGVVDLAAILRRKPHERGDQFLLTVAIVATFFLSILFLVVLMWISIGMSLG